MIAPAHLATPHACLIVARCAQKVALPQRAQQVPLIDNEVIRQARASFGGGGGVER